MDGSSISNDLELYVETQPRLSQGLDRRDLTGLDVKVQVLVEGAVCNELSWRGRVNAAEVSAQPPLRLPADTEPEKDTLWP